MLDARAVPDQSCRDANETGRKPHTPLSRRACASIQRHTAAFTLAREPRQKLWRFPAEPCENVPAFGEFFDEDPTHVAARLNEAVGPHLGCTGIRFRRCGRGNHTAPICTQPGCIESTMRRATTRCAFAS